MVDPNQRGYYRIEYPTTECPDLVVGDRTMAVIDCSESGLRYDLLETEPRPEIGSEIRGVVRFREGEEVEVEGVIVRLDGRSVAVRFTGTEIPFSTILTEQQYLRRHYLTHLRGRP